VPSFQEMPTYNIPTVNSVLMTTWHRLDSFVKRAGVTIIKVVTILTVINFAGMDGTFGDQNLKGSVLSYIDKTLTPISYPIGS
jgi:ferrous iron transport protein B